MSTLREDYNLYIHGFKMFPGKTTFIHRFQMFFAALIYCAKLEITPEKQAL